MNKYRCNDDILIRIPFNSVEYYKKELLNYDVNEFNQKLIKDFIEGIAISSYSLYDNIHNHNGKDDKLNSSMLKYLIRSSTRCTPYGINSGVLIGEFSLKKDMILKDRFIKNVRPDMEWLIKVIKMCENLIGDDLLIIRNNSYMSDKYKLSKSWNSAYIDEDNKHKKITINNTVLVKDIMNYLSNYKSIKDLKVYLGNKYRNKEVEIQKIIEILLKKEFLTSDLREILVFDNQFDILLTKLNKYNLKDDLYTKLRELKHLIEFYNKIEVSKGLEYYLNIINYMSKIQESTNYLQVDMFQKEKIKVDVSIKKDIEDLVNFLVNASYYETYDEYAMNFIDRYGNQAVKFLDVINPESGIGKPYFDQYQSIKYNDEFMCMLFDNLNNCKGNTIHLNKVEKNFISKKDSDRYPENVEVVLQIFKEKNKIKYVFPPLLGTDESMRIWGRFRYLFDNIEDNVKRKSNIKLVELSFIPQSARHANVMITHSDADYILEYGAITNNHEYNTLTLSDIYMFVDSNKRIRFINKNTMELLEFTMTNMYNLEGLPKELKILYDLTYNQKYSITSLLSSLFHLIGKMNLHSPRIEYKNIILIPECWKIDKSIFIKNGKLISLKEFLKTYPNYAKANKIPSIISAGPFDQRLTLNMENIDHLKLLYDLLYHDINTTLYENVFMENNSILKNTKNENIINEFVFELSRENKDEYIKNLKLPIVDKYMINKTKQLPFNKWVSLKLYFSTIHQDKVIIHLFEWINKQYPQISLYYLRYKDPKNHLRVRIKTDFDYYFELIKEIINNLDEQGIIDECVIDTYYPEVERYGREQCIANAENLFIADSYFCSHLLRLLISHGIDLKKEELYFISILHIIQELQINLDLVVELLDEYRLKKDDNKKYEMFINNIDFLLGSKEDILSLEKSEQGIKFMIESQMRMPEYKKYWISLLNTFDVENNYERQRIRYAFISVLHMHFNRLIGINSELEKEIIGMIRKYFYILNMRRKNYGK